METEKRRKVFPDLIRRVGKLLWEKAANLISPNLKSRNLDTCYPEVQQWQANWLTNTTSRVLIQPMLKFASRWLHPVGSQSQLKAHSHNVCLTHILQRTVAFFNLLFKLASREWALSKAGYREFQRQTTCMIWSWWRHVCVQLASLWSHYVPNPIKQLMA